MPYAIRRDGAGWRSVESPDDLSENELFSEEMPEPTSNLEDEVRNIRIPLLREADASINRLTDNGLDATAWRSYRQALRDVTLQQTFPDSVAWPDPPVD